jgi:hypothetical protein
MKTLLVAFLTLASFTLSSYADSRFYYGSSGQFEGQAIETGNGYFFYNQSGQYEGQAISTGNGYFFYDRNGSFRGQSIGQE